MSAVNPHPVIATSDLCRACDGTGVFASGAYHSRRFTHTGCETCGNASTYIDWRPCGRCKQTGNEPAEIPAGR